MQNIQFEEKDHKYHVDGEEYISVTTLIDRYVPEFNWEFWSKYKAIQRVFIQRYGDTKGKEVFNDLRDKRHHHTPGWESWICKVEKIEPEEVIKVQEMILYEWSVENETSLIKGSEYHNIKEKEAYEKGFSKNPFTKKPHRTAQVRKSPIQSLKNLKSGYYPELIIWNNDYSVIGTADRVYVSGKDIWIDDYKTNKEIKKQNMFETMLYPLEGLANCNYNHYRLQIGLYAWMMENYGYDVKGISINHEGNHMKMRYNSIKKHVEAMLNHYIGKDISNLNRIKRYGFSDIHIK